MRNSCGSYLRDVMLNRRHGAGPTVLRAALAIGEPFYAAATAMRNWMYDIRLLPSDSAGRAVICVGNITTGGTGKTPVVQWLAGQLRRAGRRPAVLLRGYKSSPTGGSDEQRLLERLLRAETANPVHVIADANRLRGAARALRLDPQIDVFILDDGFQHRRLRRDFDLVLIDATNPFGGGHQLPRGLLRESARGLRRAHAILLTRCDAVGTDEVQRVIQTVRRYNAWAPLYRCRHVQSIDPSLADQKVLSFCAIGNPEAFFGQIRNAGLTLVASHAFPDHHAYTPADLVGLEAAARQAGATLMVTTEKDWVKLEPMVARQPPGLPIQPVGLRIEFDSDDGVRLLEQIQAAIPLPVTAPSPAVSTPGAGSDAGTAFR